jgi:hypothetical protein
MLTRSPLLSSPGLGVLSIRGLGVLPDAEALFLFHWFLFHSDAVQCLTAASSVSFQGTPQLQGLDLPHRVGHLRHVVHDMLERVQQGRVPVLGALHRREHPTGLLQFLRRESRVIGRRIKFGRALPNHRLAGLPEKHGLRDSGSGRLDARMNGMTLVVAFLLLAMADLLCPAGVIGVNR